MRVAVVFFSKQNRQKLVDLSKALVRGIESRGHQVDLIDGDRDFGKKLTIYKYIAMGTETLGFFGAIPEHISRFLGQAGAVAGKDAFAFVTKAFFGAQKASIRLMASMEHEGMFVRFSSVLESTDHAEAVGARLHITKDDVVSE